MATKRCSKCKETLDLEMFYKGRVSDDNRRPECKKCNNAVIKIYREKNKEKHAAYQREYQKEYQKEYPDRANAKTAKRHAARLQRTPKWLTKRDYALMESYYIKAKLLELETGVKYHVDHIIPMQGDLVSGLHVPSNLQVITAEENRSKSNTFVVE